MTDYPYAIRDWNKDEYPTPDSLSPDQWAWEFLRRNPAYQEAWDQYDDDPESPCDYAYFSVHPSVFSPQGEREDDDEYKERTRHRLACYKLSHFGLSPYAINPRREFDDELCFSSWRWGHDSEDHPLVLFDRRDVLNFLETGIVSESLRFNMARIAYDFSQVPLLFDVRIPQTKQIDAAKRILKEKQVELENHEPPPGMGSKRGRIKPMQYRPAEFARHIRLLDAVAAGAKEKDIAPFLYPGEPLHYEDGYECPVIGRISKAIKRAIEIRDVEYGLITRQERRASL